MDQIGAIMSASFNSRVLWWKGFSLDTGTTQDDMAILANALGYRADDYTNTPTAGSALNLTNGAAQVSGIISNDSDQDWFTLNWTGGAFTLDARGGTYSNKLDPRLEVRDASGANLLASGEDPAVGQLLNVNLPAGTYRIGVMSGSHLDNGVSTHYGEAGEYTLNVTSGNQQRRIALWRNARANCAAANPTTIQFEDYDFGGEGVGYHTTSSLADSGYRDGEGIALNVSNITSAADEGYTSYLRNAGDWTNYTVNVAQAGTYAFALRAASPNGGEMFHLEADGQNASGPLSIAVTGSSYSFRTTVYSTLISLSAGQHVLRLVTDSTSQQSRINWFQLVPVGAGGQTPFNLTPFKVSANATSTLQAEDFDKGGQGVAYNDTTPATNTGGSYRTTEGVDIKPTTDTGGGFRISDAFAGEWLEYSINVAATGTYDLAVRVGSPGAGGAFHLELDGQIIGRQLATPNTGAYDSMQDVTLHGVQLTAGAHILRLSFDSVSSASGAAGGFNYIKFTPVAPPTVSIAVTDASTYYLPSDPGRPANNGAFTITRTGSIDTDLWVNFNVAGTAIAGADYAPVGTVVLIPAGQTSADVIIEPNGAPSGHTQATVILSLAANLLYSVATNNTANLTITTAPPVGQISGDVFGDFNDNGVQDGNEPDFSAQTVYIDQNDDGAFEAGEPTATTNGPGEYTFPNLAPGTYVLRPSLTGGYVQTSPANNAPITVTLSLGQSVSGADFGIYLPPVAPASATINGTIFNDYDKNGIQEPGETGAGLSGRTVYLDLNNNGTLDSNEPSTITDGSGNYQLTGLAAGTYKVREVLFSGWNQSTPANDFGLNVTLAAHQIASGKNFGIYQLPFDSGSITGEIYNDTNNNGSKDSGETGIVGRTVYLDLNNNSILDSNETSTTTDALGNYQFLYLPAGSYKVRQVLPTGWTQSTPSKGYGWSVTLTANQSAIGKDFGAYQAPLNTASIAGTIYNDTNGNGVKDSGDAGISGQTLYIDLNNNSKLDPGEQSTMTGTSGAYQFTNLAAGTYKVRQLLPTGWTQTTPSNGFGWSVTLIANQAASGKDFGAKQTVVGTASISGQIFNDKNGNGTQDSGESGLANREVYIDLDNDGVLDSNETFVMTDASGNYKLAALLAGTYKVRQVLPAGSSQTTPSKGFGWSVTLTTGQSATGKNFGAKTA